MRSLVATMWLLTLTACSVNLEGAHCSDDSNCPKDQRCDTATQKCVACVSDPECSEVGWACSSDGTALLRCAYNSGSCFYSIRTVCSAGCSAQKCNCPQNSGPDFYADTVASSQSGLFNAPTGVSDPPDCRFKTITEALDAANLHRPGSRAIAAGGSDQSPMIFSAGETFPLEVKPGATLTTSDATPTPAHYVIEVAEAGPSRPVVQLNEDAAVTGFTIRPVGSGSASVAILVNCQTAGSGTVSVNGMVLDGKGALAQAAIDYAFHLEGACSASVSGVTAENCAKSGVLLESIGGATVTVASVTIIGNGDTGLRVWLNSADTVTLNLNQNEITQNFATSSYGPPSRTVGGVLFYGNKPASMTFQRNRVYGNKGDQILLFSGQSGWTLNGGNDSSVCGNGSNTITCYDSGAVGLSEVSSGTVDARFNAWSNLPPTANIDYFQTGAGIINATGAGNDVCPVVTMSCP